MRGQRDVVFALAVLPHEGGAFEAGHEEGWKRRGARHSAGRGVLHASRDLLPDAEAGNVPGNPTPPPNALAEVPYVGTSARLLARSVLEPAA